MRSDLSLARVLPSRSQVVLPRRPNDRAWNGELQVSRNGPDFAPAPATGIVPVRRSRVVVDGKLFRHGQERLKISGVTYGPFAPNAAGEPLPEPVAVAADFARMRAASINAVRIYNPPPAWFLDLADAHGLFVLIEIPCPKHLDFLESETTRRESRERVAKAVRETRGHPSVLGCCIGNEISSDIIRWYGAKRIERFIGELADVARQADPEVLVTYASYPPTEYLELPDLDFTTFNVYLHDRAIFRRYLLRLANLHVDRPLVLGELGMDTIRHGEEEQAEFLGGHLAETALTGLAGAFVFSWTDDWYVHDWQIEDWAFGLTRRDRSPKKSLATVAKLFSQPPAAQLPRTPRVSVVVCSYNGGRTLEQCLRSLGTLAYPDYEVILVDDGSTDDTPAIAARFPEVKTIRQPNQGLSVARNVGMQAATGEIVAYTDSDCFADADWLTLLMHQLETTGAAAVGGPNLTPEDGWLAACVACSPGQPNHVLETDQDAEHIPGCNMAFRRDALLAISGFDPQFRKAGDDVDLCWRLLEAGYKIAFAPGAFVWHHRRQGPRAYLKQQAGYGEAEALLAKKHPERFNLLGAGIWRGVMYGGGVVGLRLGRKHIHGGVFGQGLFQTLYQAAPAHWAMIPSTIEWHGLTLLMWLGAALGFRTLNEAIPMTALIAIIAALQAAQARPAKSHEGFAARCVIALLCWLQPLVRAGQRYRTRFGSPAVPPAEHGTIAPWLGPVKRYITMHGVDRADFLRRAAEELRRRGHQPMLDTGWSRWDLEVACAHGMKLQARTVQERYEGNSAQIVVEFRLRRSAFLNALPIIAALIALLTLAIYRGHFHPSAIIGCSISGVLLGSWGWLYRRGKASAARAAAVIDESAKALGMTPFTPERDKQEPPK